LSLDELIKDCKKNNTKAQGELYKLFSSKLFSVCLKYSRSHAEAQDNLQDAFIIIFNKINQFKNKGSFEGWLKRITINTTLQRYRKTALFQIVDEAAIEDKTVEVDEDDSNEIPLHFLLDIIQDLPDRYRLVFNLYVLDGYSHKEISELLKITIGTSKSNLNRARALLKDRVTTYKKKLNTHHL
jgi:RNA polymerase sigma-70 factor (ECF subfamily)